MKEKFPEEMIFEAVKGMVPHNRLGRKLITKLFVYPGEGVSHEAQKPEKITV
jgi:large subunit ribosomal protein L13